jgi:hypothetical protein
MQVTDAVRGSKTLGELSLADRAKRDGPPRPGLGKFRNVPTDVKTNTKIGAALWIEINALRTPKF